jgi:hypothetical protein
MLVIDLKCARGATSSNVSTHGRSAQADDFEPHGETVAGTNRDEIADFLHTGASHCLRSVRVSREQS